MQGPLVAMSNLETNKALAEHASPEKKGEKASIIELKNGKVVCRQKIVSFEKQSETLQEIVKFRAMLEERLENEESPLTELPEEYGSLIAKLAHESDKGLAPLAKHIRQELLPVQDEEDAEKTAKANAILPQSVVEAAINSTLDRNNYGLDVPSGVKLPALLCVWRWEVKEQFKDYLPKNGRDKADSRLEERKAAKKVLNLHFESLPQSERDTILRIKGSKLPKVDANNAETSTPEPSERIEIVTSESAKKQGKKKAEEVDDDDEAGTSPNKGTKKAKAVDPEKAAKEKERLEKKAARAEKERKAKDAQDKSRSIMASFFAKPKVTITKTKEASSSGAGPSSVRSDFEKTFKPFIKKKDSVIAPVNWFKTRRARKQSELTGDSDVIIIDDGETGAQDVQMSSPQPTESELVKMTKTVRDIMNQLSEAEVAGDDHIVRQLLAKLQDRALFPPKVFIFHEDARPGYYGTWTRSSRIIGPRRPLAKDLLTFDYGYDSGEEWEEEPAGEDVADDDEEEEDGEEPDSDADSWLVDDDEEAEPVNLDDFDSLSPPEIWDLPPPPSKRKADDSEKKHSKKRKVVVPLVAFAKGPCWEERIGECSYDPFKAYRIQLFNDTPHPIDPFTYVSTCIEDHRASVKAAAQAQAAANAAPTTNDGFAVPAVPARFNGGAPAATNGNGTTAAAPTPSNSTPSDASGANSTQPGTKKAPALKTPFPDSQLPFLLKKISELDTGSFVLLVESVYEALKSQKVTKASIEAKIREVGEKDKAKKKQLIRRSFVRALFLLTSKDHNLNFLDAPRTLALTLDCPTPCIIILPTSGSQIFSAT
ncbi:hypothetical protein EST38_g7884 [Candolleomyces aberdarensis]|uniref:Chromatin assembly factor 1 subunit A dimerization domain-containing protein n=1 Tax=Candolleomyces aberdarensis TaxID=2316362 RepID=A0A4Q2DFT7_9AGAR|nr:hypothetical protein EST38_g7884 [Candolleomyces aberdarensis]